MTIETPSLASSDAPIGSLPLFEPIRKPDRHARKSKKHIPRKDECVIDYRRYRKQKKGKVQSGVKYIADRLNQFVRGRNYRQSQDITELAFSRPEV